MAGGGARCGRPPRASHGFVVRRRDTEHCSISPFDPPKRTGRSRSRLGGFARAGMAPSRRHREKDMQRETNAPLALRHQRHKYAGLGASGTRCAARDYGSSLANRQQCAATQARLLVPYCHALSWSGKKNLCHPGLEQRPLALDASDSILRLAWRLALNAGCQPGALAHDGL